MQRHERLYLQYRPDDPALPRLHDYQQRAVAVNPHGRIVNAERLHMTLIHFGILMELYEECKKSNPSLSWNQFETAVKEFVYSSQSLMPETIELVPLRYAFYGPKKSVLGLELQPDERLRKAHTKALGALKDCLFECGVPTPEHFMLRSPNLRFAQSFNPHITLVRMADQAPESLEESTPLLFHSLPILYK
jgi:hypothetical protein